MSNVFEVLNSPVVTVAIGVALSTFAAATTAVIGLFVKVSAMSTRIKAIAEDVAALVGDKDIMRWSQWGPMEHRPNGTSASKREQS